MKIFPKISFWFLNFLRFNINRFQEITEFVDTFAFSSSILVETFVTNIKSSNKIGYDFTLTVITCYQNTIFKDWQFTRNTLRTCKKNGKKALNMIVIKDLCAFHVIFDTWWSVQIGAELGIFVFFSEKCCNQILLFRASSCY